MNKILVVLTIDIENLPANFSQILQEERVMVSQWKKDGFLDQLFLRPSKDGAVMILKNLDEEAAHNLVKELPFYALKKSILIIPLIQDMQI
jgi:hypothetical protein